MSESSTLKWEQDADGEIQLRHLEKDEYDTTQKRIHNTPMNTWDAIRCGELAARVEAGARGAEPAPTW